MPNVCTRVPRGGEWRRRERGGVSVVAASGARVDGSRLEPSGSTVLGAWRASTARAARGRAVCVTPLGASAWLCAERVGERGALTRAHARTHGHPVGHARAALSRALAPVCTQHTLPGGATCCPRSVLRLAGSAASCDPRSLHCPGSRAWRRQRTSDPFTFPCCRLAGSATSCDPRSLHCPGSVTAFARQ